MQNKIAIVAVAYNRIGPLKRLLVHLSNAYYPDENIPLIISIDKSDTDEVEQFADNYQWSHGLKIVDKHQENLGLRNHMMSLGKWFEEYDALIILEDDIIPSPSFYYYAMSATEKYANNEKVGGISLYNFSIHYATYLNFTPLKSEYDVYLIRWAMSWGEIWLKNQWEDFYKWYLDNMEFTYDPRIPATLFSWSKKSWLKYHTRYLIERDKFFVYPYVSLTTNGAEPGEHYKFSDSTFQVPLQYGVKRNFNMPDSIDDLVCYDEYLENTRLNLSDYANDICIDLTGSKKDSGGLRYLLTYKHLNYKIIKSYGASFRPIEVNVIDNVAGSDIFLYDTSVDCRNKIDSLNIQRYFYSTFNLYWRLKGVGLKNFIHDALIIIKQKYLK